MHSSVKPDSGPDNRRIERISTDELMSRVGSPEVKIIDIRSADAYNGWKERGELRGGHIRNAKSFPAKLTKYENWTEILQSKNILQDDHLILYGYEKEETESIARHFQENGYSNVRAYHSFVEEWSRNEGYPVEKMPRYTQLVSAKWLKSLVDNGSAPAYSNSKFVICHAHYRRTGDYERGHIPLAVDVDTNTLESEETWNVRPPAELEETLEKLGITQDTTVIVYGRQSVPKENDPYPGSSVGHLAAMRVAFIMLYAGVKDVRILNGGLQSWVDEGFELTREEFLPKRVSGFGVEVPLHPELAVDIVHAKDILNSESANLISMRSWKEYIGEVSGYNYIESKGRIPGSVFGDNGSNAYFMENYRNPDHTTRDYNEILERWEKKGITPDKFNAFYCGTGWRASEGFMDAWFMGWSRIGVFDGGWFQWSNNGYGFETGVPD